MRVLGDQAAVLAVCTVLLVLEGTGQAALTWWLGAVVAAGAHSLADNATRVGGPAPGPSRPPGPRTWARATLLPCAALLVVACVNESALVGAPLAAHELARALVAPRAGTAERVLALPAVVCLAVGLSHAYDLAVGGTWASASYVLACVTAVALAALLGARTAQAETTLADLHRVRDDLQEKITALSASRARLLSAQDAENRAAVLGERTRIARDIHDGVGHQLTRLLFQVRALEVTHRDDPAVVRELGAVGAGVGEALDAMRSSVHALADDAEDLATGLHVLAGRSPIEDVTVSCEVGQDLPTEVSRCFVAVVREALTNAARHGRARQAVVSVVEYPGFWRAVVTNDGVPAAPSGRADGSTPEGMGLCSMRERVEALGGTLRVGGAPRFKVLATVPRPAAPARLSTPTTPKEPR